MSRKKEVITVETNDEKLVERFYQKIFFEGVRKDTLSVSGEFLYVETEDKIYRMRAMTFGYIFDPSFEHIYTQDLPKTLELDELGPSSIAYLYDWTNPAFEEMGVPYTSKFISNFKNQVKQSYSYYLKIREISFTTINALDVKSRKKYTDRFIELGIFTEKDKVRLEYYIDEPISKIEELIGNGTIDREDVPQIVSRIFSYERAYDEERNEKRKNKRKYNARIVGAMNLLDAPDIVDVYLSDGLNEEEFSRTKVKKADILAISYTALLSFLEDKNDKVPESLRITSQDLINAYGRTLTGSTIYKLAMYGYIEPEDVIQAYEINKALKMVDYESMFEDEEIAAFYTPQRLYEMRYADKLTPEFIEKYREMLNLDKDEERFRRYSEELVGGLRKTVQSDDKELENRRLQENVLYFFKKGLCDVETTRGVVTPEYIEDRFTNDEMSIEEIFELYEKGIVSDEFISKFYTDQEIIDLYESGKLRRGCLRAVTNHDLLIESYVEKKVNLQDFVELYLKSDNLSADDLIDAFELSEEEVDISNFIDETTPFEKIKELFRNLLIDYSTVLTLHAQGAISDEQLNEIKKALDTRKLFDEINQRKVFKVVTARKAEGTKPVIDPKPRPVVEDDFSLEIELISKILGKEDVEEEPYSQISSYNTKGRATSLNNYRIFGNEDLDGIVILQKSKRQNAVFVMSAYQLMYFLKGKESETGEIEVQDRMKDKAYLKTIVGVEVVEHTRHFARNLAEAAGRVSPKVAETLRGEETRYRVDVQDMVDGLRELYDEEKAKGRDDN